LPSRAAVASAGTNLQPGSLDLDAEIPPSRNGLPGGRLEAEQVEDPRLGGGAIKPLDDAVVADREAAGDVGHVHRPAGRPDALFE